MSSIARCMAWAVAHPGPLTQPLSPSGQRARWSRSASSRGYTRAVFDVTSTTVTTPRPRRCAVLLAPSLLTMTAGRCLSASAPRTGSRSTSRISPRRIRPARPQPWVPRVRRRRPFPTLPMRLRRRHPTPQRVGVGLLCGSSRSETRSPPRGVRVEELHVLVRQADADLHTIVLPMIPPWEQRQARPESSCGRQAAVGGRRWLMRSYSSSAGVGSGSTARSARYHSMSAEVELSCCGGSSEVSSGVIRLASALPNSTPH